MRTLAGRQESVCVLSVRSKRLRAPCLVERQLRVVAAQRAFLSLCGEAIARRPEGKGSAGYIGRRPQSMSRRRRRAGRSVVRKKRSRVQ